MASLRYHAIAVITLLSLSATCQTARGEFITLEPEPPMAWQELVDCELVVVGKYQSHQNDVLTLHVERVLKGDVKKGDSLDVQLADLWSVETGPVDDWWQIRDTKKDGKPRICYWEQRFNPGPMVPYSFLEPDESAIFFFPKSKPVLDRLKQIMLPQLADGWQRAVRGEKLDLAFRLGQPADTKLAEEAFAELKASRDPRILDLLVEDIVQHPNWYYYGRPKGRFQNDLEYRPQFLLIGLGDKNGDVYDRVLAKIKPALEAPDYAAYRLPEVLAAVDPDRALVQFREWIETEPAESKLRKVAASALGSVFNEGAMKLAISLMPDEEVGNQAFHSVWSMVGNRHTIEQFCAPRETHRAVWEIANQRLSGTTPPSNLSERNRTSYQWMIRNELGDQGKRKLFGDAAPR